MLNFRKNKKPFYIAASLAFAVLLHYAGLLTSAETAIVRILSPVLIRAQAVSAGLRSLYLRQASREDLASDMQAIKEENARLAKEIAAIRIAEVENRILREQLKFFSDNPLAYVAANVISRGSLYLGSGQELLIIDRGSDDGVAAGMAVVSGEGVLVGKVREARNRSASVVLVTSNDCRLAAMVLGSDQTSGIAEGDLGLSIRMNFIPQSIELKPGDLVVSSGLEESIPRGLLIGRVNAAEKENNELWQNAVISPYGGLDELLIVSVVTTGSAGNN